MRSTSIAQALMIINYILVSVIITASSILFMGFLSILIYKIHPFLFFICFLSIFLRVGFFLILEVLWNISFTFMEIFQSKYIIKERCPICLENGKMIVFPCKHHFHRKCIEQWIDSHHSAQKVNCPLCRKSLLSWFFRLSGKHKIP
jgi:hypothetical protein